MAFRSARDANTLSKVVSRISEQDRRPKAQKADINWKRQAVWSDGLWFPGVREEESV